MKVSYTAQNGLCCSCGICKNLCNRDAITYKRHNGMYIPVIDENKCSNCGICIKACPGASQTYPEETDPRKAAEGQYIECFNAWSKDDNIRFISASGGFVTTLIMNLLKQKKYDAAFCVDSYSYDNQLCTQVYKEQDFENPGKWQNTPKSRYLPVSHENLISYIKTHKNERVIIVAIPCATNGIVRAIEQLKLNRNNYLVIGLFCQKQFQYNFNEYVKSIAGGELQAFHFKNKESGNWPGNMKFLYADGREKYMSSSCRTDAKDYFQMERCLYCIDKLAVHADISVGDNYTHVASSPNGSNSVIIRTDIGLSAVEACQDFIEKVSVPFEKISGAEALNERAKQYYWGLKKEEHLAENDYKTRINAGVVSEDDYHDLSMYYTQLAKAEVGLSVNGEFSEYKKIISEVKKRRKKEKILCKIKTPLSIVKRKLKAVLKR